MKGKRVILSLIVTIFMFLNFAPAYANQFVTKTINDIVEEKYYCSATLEDNFSSDKIIVVLKNSESLKFKTYSTLDFNSVRCIKIENLTDTSSKQIKSKIAAINVELKDKVTDNSTNGNYTINTSRFHQILVLTLEQPGKENVLDAIKVLEQRDDVLIAEPNYISYVDFNTNSYPLDTNQVLSLPANTLNTTTINDPYDPRNRISLSQAWNISTGSDTINVGVLDSGIDATHPDLIGHMNISLSYDCTYESANAGTGCDDPKGHGTHVAGIIGANTNNSIGISGVCQNIKLVSLRVIDPNDNSLEYCDVVRAVTHAQGTLADSIHTNDIPILNMSFRCTDSTYWAAVRTAIDDYDGYVICSAGNDNLNNDFIEHLPSDYSIDLANVISVGASNLSDIKAWFSNYGEMSVDLFAPGSDILNCYPLSKCETLMHDLDTHYADGYHLMSGTSMAAPYVTGTVALMVAEKPSLLNSEYVYDIESSYNIKNILNNTVDRIDAFDGLCVSGGRLNAFAAVSACHTHLFVYTYTSSQHSATCRCGATISPQAHRWMELDGITICRICGYTP